MGKTTLEILDLNLELAQDNGFRPHLGASQVGHKCDRYIYYVFRWALKSDFSAATLRNFRDGHHSEDITAEELERAVKLVDRQWSFRDGHFGGSIDGVIESGLAEAPDTPHVWEHKAVNPRSFERLKTLISAANVMKDTDALPLKEWNETYYAQAMIYCRKRGIHNHVLTVASAGSRDLLLLRTPYDDAYAEALENRANTIIEGLQAPVRLFYSKYDKPCAWCQFKPLCYEGALPDKNCRTCRYSKAESDGSWRCMVFESGLDEAKQARGCEEYRRFLDDGRTIY